jgi:hypothetical protein
MLGSSPCLCPIETCYLLRLILDNPQTEDLGNRPANDDFYPPSPFYRGNTAKVDGPSEQLWLGVEEGNTLTENTMGLRAVAHQGMAGGRVEPGEDCQGIILQQMLSPLTRLFIPGGRHFFSRWTQ